jgi:hypothetical protein
VSGLTTSTRGTPQYSETRRNVGGSHRVFWLEMIERSSPKNQLGMKFIVGVQGLRRKIKIFLAGCRDVHDFTLSSFHNM